MPLVDLLIPDILTMLLSYISLSTFYSMKLVSKEINAAIRNLEHCQNATLLQMLYIKDTKHKFKRTPCIEDRSLESVPHRRTICRLALSLQRPLLILTNVRNKNEWLGAIAVTKARYVDIYTVPDRPPYGSSNNNDVMISKKFLKNLMDLVPLVCIDVDIGNGNMTIHGFKHFDMRYSIIASSLARQPIVLFVKIFKIVTSETYMKRAGKLPFLILVITNNQNIYRCDPDPLKSVSLAPLDGHNTGIFLHLSPLCREGDSEKDKEDQYIKMLHAHSRTGNGSAKVMKQMHLAIIRYLDGNSHRKVCIDTKSRYQIELVLGSSEFEKYKPIELLSSDKHIDIALSRLTRLTLSGVCTYYGRSVFDVDRFILLTETIGISQPATRSYHLFALSKKIVEPVVLLCKKKTKRITYLNPIEILNDGPPKGSTVVTEF